MIIGENRHVDKTMMFMQRGFIDSKADEWINEIITSINLPTPRLK